MASPRDRFNLVILDEMLMSMVLSPTSTTRPPMMDGSVCGGAGGELEAEGVGGSGRGSGSGSGGRERATQRMG